MPEKSVPESLKAASSGAGEEGFPTQEGTRGKATTLQLTSPARDTVSHSGKQTELGLGIFSGKHLTMDLEGELKKICTAAGGRGVRGGGLAKITLSQRTLYR